MGNFNLPISHTYRCINIGLDSIAEDECIIFFLQDLEERGSIKLWKKIKEHQNRAYIEICNFGKEFVEVSVNGENKKQIAVIDELSIYTLLKDNKIIFDITGLPYEIWAPIFKAAFKYNISTKILYAEPEEYKLHENPASSSFFDLSSEFEGSAPLPGFAKLSEPERGQHCIFITLLGFEGNRPRALIYQLDPPPKVIPIVGIPGFQVEFPTYTVSCNQELLNEFQAHSDIRYSKASCPFEVYETLTDIRRDYLDSYMYIAPIGTKPHGLGAIYYCLRNPKNSEILYDHPVRKKDRTKGIGIIHIYNFGNFDGN